MKRWTLLLAVVALGVLLAMGCSGGGESPMSPNMEPGITSGTEYHGTQNQVLWGYYDLYFDFANQTVEAVPNRDVMFTANVVQFLNGNPANLGFDIIGTPVDPDFIDVDIDVSISHPFPGIHQYDGYDVRGIFMGIGSMNMDYGDGLIYPDLAVDQAMYDFDLTEDDIHEGLVGNPDGYTRWWNASEFTAPGPLGYIQGKLATPGYQGELSATLNPYKYYADGLGVEDDLWTWLEANGDSNGLFEAGSTNTRNYYLRFPTATGVTYGYAVTATWGEPSAEDDPAEFVENAVEAVACSVDVTDNIYFVSESDNGGDFIADVMLYGWEYQPSTIYIETTVNSSAVMFDAEAVATGGGENYSTYSVDFTPDNIVGLEGNEYWVIAEYGDFDYTCDYPAPVPDATLAAFFRYDLTVLEAPPCDGPIVTDMVPATATQDSVLDDATINGDEFDDGVNLSASLTNGTDTVIGTDVTFVDVNTLTADFDLTGAPLGFYDLKVTKGTCPTVTTLISAFEIIESAGPMLKDSGDLPDPLPTSDIVDLSVVGTTAFGYDGVYYHYATSTTSYYIYSYPLDYSADGTQHVMLVDPFFGDINGLLGGPNYPEQIEVVASGPVVFTSSFTGPMSWGGYPGFAPVWWCGTDGLLDNGYVYFNMEFHDLEKGFGATSRLWGYWGNNPTGVDGAQYYLDAPYGAFDYSSYTGYYPADHTGSVDGQVSDNEALKYTVDDNPEGLNSPFNIIHYYMEGPPDEYGVEIMSNISNMAFPTSLYTIDDDEFTGDPVDISCAEVYGDLGSAAGNWLCILEDNGDSTWNLAVYEQDGTFIGRAGPYDGDPWHVDVDMVNDEPHVWYDDAGTPGYAIFTLN